MTVGIVEEEGEPSPNWPSMFVVKCKSYDAYYHGEGKDWHRTKESAVAKAEAHRQMRLKSLRKQLAKIEALKFK